MLVDLEWKFDPSAFNPECLSSITFAPKGKDLNVIYDMKHISPGLGKSVLKIKHLKKGIYKCFSFNFQNDIKTFTDYKKVSWSDIAYGVADSVPQILKHHKEYIEDPNIPLVVSITEVYRKYQPIEGGWRWHKWGEYIGKYKIKHEYLYDEDISKVLVYNIISLKK